LENLKTSVLTYSKKPNVIGRFKSVSGKEKEAKQLADGSSNVASSSAGASAGAAMADATDKTDTLVQSILDLFPGYEIDLIKV
jgi:hypothetical protein